MVLRRAKVTVQHEMWTMTFEEQNEVLNEEGLVNINAKLAWGEFLDATDPDAKAKAFAECYYYTFDYSAEHVVQLYHENSMVTLEGQKYPGQQAIMDKVREFRSHGCKHGITTVDGQLSGPTGGLIVYVCGTLQLAAEVNHRSFTQLFHLMPTPQRSFFVLNDIFRLNYG